MAIINKIKSAVQTKVSLWFQVTHNGVTGLDGSTQPSMSMKAHLSKQTLQSPYAKKLTELEKGNVIRQVNLEEERTVQVSLHVFWYLFNATLYKHGLSCSVDILHLR